MNLACLLRHHGPDEWIPVTEHLPGGAIRVRHLRRCSRCRRPFLNRTRRT